MNQFEVNINVTLKALEKQLIDANKQANNLGKGASLTPIVTQSEKIKANLIAAGIELAKISAKAFSGMQTQFRKAGILQGMGADLGTVNARANMADPYINTLNTTKQLSSAILNISNNLNKATIEAKQFQAVMNSSSAITGRFLQGVTPMKAIGAGFSAIKDSAGTMFASIRSGISNSLVPFREKMAANRAETERLNKSVRGNSSLLGAWWQHFGRIAIGFTVAYRAMNAFGMLLQKTSQTILTAIKESGDLAALQGKLAMFTVMASKSTIGFDQAFKQSGVVVQNLAQSSVRSISSIAELGIAMDELAQAGVLVPPNLTKEFVSFVDFTSLIAQTTGDNVRQLRSEISGFMDGQKRANNQLIRSMINFGIVTKQDLDDLRKMHNRAEITEKVMKKIHETWTKFVDKLLESNPAVALDVWDKSIRRTLTGTITLTSQSMGQFNLFAVTLKKHIDAWQKAFSGDMTKNIDVKRFAIMFIELNKVLDFTLTAFESIIKGVAMLATAFNNLDESIKKILKIILVWEAMMLLYKVLAGIGGLIVKLNAGFMAYFTTVSAAGLTTMTLFGQIMLLGGAVFVLGNAISVLTGYVFVIDTQMNWFEATLKRVIKEVSAFKMTLIGVFAGLAIGKTPTAGLVGGMIGLATDLLASIYKADKTQPMLLKKLQGENESIIKQIKDNYANRIIAEKDGNKMWLDRIDANIARLTKRKVDINAQIKDLQGAGPSAERSFYADVLAQSMESLEVLISSGLSALTPLKDKMMAVWRDITNPKIDLTKMAGMEDPFKTFVKDTEEDLKEIDKLLGSIASNMYERFIKAVNEGNIAKAELFASPAKKEILYDLDALAKKIPILKTALRLTEGTTEGYKYRAMLASVNAQIVDLTDNLNNIPRLKALTPAVSIATHFKDEYEIIMSTMKDGSLQQTQALIDLREKYKDAMKSFTILPDDKKQMSVITDFYNIWEKLVDVTLDWKVGLKAGLDEISKPQVFEMFKDVVVSGFKTMEDAIVNFATQGKAAFKDMANSILNDLLRIIVRMQVIQPLAGLLNTTFFSGVTPTGPVQGASANFPKVAPYVHTNASGGWINEKIIGIGLSTGTLHSFAENGPEYVSPKDEVGGTVINIINNTPAQVQATESKSGGGKRIDIMIDEIMAGKLSGGSKSSMVLKKMYGLQTALAGR